MKDIYVYDGETEFILKHSGKYYPFIGMKDKDELICVIKSLNDNLRFYSILSAKHVKEQISKLDFLSLNEWLILN